MTKKRYIRELNEETKQKEKYEDKLTSLKSNEQELIKTLQDSNVTELYAIKNPSNVLSRHNAKSLKGYESLKTSTATKSKNKCVNTLKLHAKS